MAGLIEWTCIQAVNPFLDWPKEQTVGTHINVSHVAATPPGLKVIAKIRLVEVDGRRLVFEVEAHDGVDLITRGIHERFVINADKLSIIFYIVISISYYIYFCNSLYFVRKCWE